MKMNSRERVMAALKREEPDQVPFCELAIDRALAERLMGWPAGEGRYSASLSTNPYTVEESKALASFLGCDNIGYILRAPTYAHLGAGKDGRSFLGEGMIKTEADLETIQLPDPRKDDFYRDAEHFSKNKGDFALALVTRIGLFQTILSMGTEHFAVSLYINRPLVEKILDIYFDWMAIVAKRICQIGFDIFWTTDDFAYKTGLFFSVQAGPGKSDHSLVSPQRRKYYRGPGHSHRPRGGRDPPQRKRGHGYPGGQAAVRG
jgi:uroporphyrinogen decarboxylase